MANTLISSQRYLDDETIEAKLFFKDFACTYVTVHVDGVDYNVLVDGHHSWEAARLAGEVPELFRDCKVQQDVDALGSETWLEAHQHDSDWYVLETGKLVW